MTSLSLKLLEQQRRQLDGQHHDPQDTVHEQLQSPLFKLPPELRDVVWSYACAASSDMSRPYEPNSHYCRPPEYTHAPRIDTAMLLTCRKAYLECCHLPLSVNEHVFWAYRGPRGEPPLDIDSREEVHGYYEDTDLEEDDTPWHLEAFRSNRETPFQFIRTVHWFVQQYWLECDNFMHACRAKEMANVETFTVTLRRSDFWNWEQGRPIGLDPRLPVSVTASRMKETWAKEKAGAVIPHHAEAWGTHLRHLPRLKRFTFELEGERSQEPELQAIIDHAQAYWTFPHHTGRLLTAGKEVDVRRWTGPPCMAARRRSFTRVSEKPELVKFALSFTAQA